MVCDTPIQRHHCILAWHSVWKILTNPTYCSLQYMQYSRLYHFILLLIIICLYSVKEYWGWQGVFICILNLELIFLISSPSWHFYEPVYIYMLCIPGTYALPIMNQWVPAIKQAVFPWIIIIRYNPQSDSYGLHLELKSNIY